MRILLVGDGAREHALAKAIGKSAELYSVMRHRNPGILELSRASYVSDFSSIEAIGAWAIRKKIDLALISSEAAMARGLHDVFTAAGIPLASPKSEGSIIGENTLYAYNLMTSSGIPTPDFEICHNKEEVEKAINRLKHVVVKPSIKVEWSGAKFIDRDLENRDDVIRHSLNLIKRHGSVVLERFMDGELFSVQAFCDGKTLAGMHPVKICRRLRTGGGPLTEGMGAYCKPNLPFLKKKDYTDARSSLKKILTHLKKRGIEFKGCLGGTFIAGKSGISMVDLKSTFGSLETICTLPLLNIQFSEILRSISTGTLAPVDFSNECSVSKFVTYDTYPSEIRKPRLVTIDVKDVWNQGVAIYHESSIKEGHSLYLKKGRGLALLAVDKDIRRAEDRVEKAVHSIHGQTMHRPDIATEENIRKAKKHMALIRM